jgi:hypothetical protein
MSVLEEKLICLVTELGKKTGEQLQCLISAEISAHMDRIKQLQAVLDGTNCNANTTQ